MATAEGMRGATGPGRDSANPGIVRPPQVYLAAIGAGLALHFTVPAPLVPDWHARTVQGRFPELAATTLVMRGR